MDEGLNGQVRYDLRCGSDLFMVEPISGRISSITALKQYVNNTVECKGFARDQGFPSMISDVSHFSCLKLWSYQLKKNHLGNCLYSYHRFC